MMRYWSMLNSGQIFPFMWLCRRFGYLYVHNADMSSTYDCDDCTAIMGYISGFTEVV